MSEPADALCRTGALRIGAAHALLASDDVPVTIIGDSVGFIAQRIIATIVNIAANIAQRGIAEVEDLEAAVRIGLGYPFGPLHWGERIGAARILQILSGADAGDWRSAVPAKPMDRATRGARGVSAYSGGSAMNVQHAARFRTPGTAVRRVR